MRRNTYQFVDWTDYQIVATRPHDDLPCDFCGRNGSVAVLKVQNDSVDACDACLTTLRERQQFQPASKVKVSQMAAKLRKVAAEMEKMANAKSAYDSPVGIFVAFIADDEFTKDNPLRC
jgi:hypothetical protein